MADDPDLVARPEPVVHLPVLEQVVEDGVQLFLGRIPGLEQVVVHVGLIDGGDGRVGVGVRREQDPTSLGIQVAGLLEELDARHPWHPLIRHQQTDLLVSQLQLLECIQGRRARLRSPDAVLLTVLLAQVAGQGS